MPKRVVAQAGDNISGRQCVFSGHIILDGDTVRVCDECGAPTIERRVLEPQVDYIERAGYRCAVCGGDLRVEGDPGYVPPKGPEVAAAGPPPPPPEPGPSPVPQPAPPEAKAAPLAVPSGLSLPGPMTLVDALDKTFRIYRSCFKPIIAGSALIHVTTGVPLIGALVALSIAMPNLMQSNLRVLLSEEYFRQAQNPFWQYQVDSVALLLVALGLFALAGVVYILLAGWGYATQACAALAGFQGQEISVGEALAQGRPFHWSALGQRILVSLIVGAAFSCCVLPAAFVAPLFLLCLPAIIVERIGALDSLGRSVDIVRRDYWRLFGWTVVLYVIYYAVQYGIYALAMATSGLLATAVGSAVANGIQNGLSQAAALVLSPIITVGSVVFYLDARVRQEAIDVLAGAPLREAQGPPAPPAPGSPSA